MECDFKFGLKRRLYNYNMKLGKERLGLRWDDIAAITGINKTRLMNFQSFKLFPKLEEQIKIAELLESSIDSLFPEDIKDFTIKKAPVTIDDATITLTEAKSLHLLDSPLLVEGWEDEVVRDMVLPDLVEEVISTLKPQERHVLRLRFGLEDGESKTAKEVGEEMGVTRARIHQIEAKALRRLRHPTRAKKLADFLD